MVECPFNKITSTKKERWLLSFLVKAFCFLSNWPVNTAANHSPVYHNHITEKQSQSQLDSVRRCVCRSTLLRELLAIRCVSLQTHQHPRRLIIVISLSLSLPFFSLFFSVSLSQLPSLDLSPAPPQTNTHTHTDTH